MKRILSWLVIACLAISLCAVASAEGEQPTVIDFEDGVFAFVGMDTAKGNADASELSVVEFNGSNALKVQPQGKVPYVAFNVEGLLGENLANLRSVSFDIAVDEAEDGKFYAVSGCVYAYTGEDNAENKGDWSVYLAKKNPKTATYALKDDVAFVAGAGNYLAISKEVDNYVTAGGAPLAIYIDNVQFLDAEGNALPLDLTAEFVAADTARDMSNLYALTNVVEFPGFSVSGDAWAQNGLEMPEEIVDALVPGSVIEIDFESEDGTMWIVMPWAEAGWSRVADNGGATIIGNKAYVTYEQIEAVCGEDKATWGAMLQCEASSPWQVYALKVGTCGEMKPVSALVALPGFDVTGDAWAQNGVEMTEEFLAALVPGSVITINFESEDGTIWVVMPWAEAGWSRVADNGGAAISGNTAQVTYEQIEAVCGEDKATWGAMLQCESSSPWHVYSLSVGQAG